MTGVKRPETEEKAPDTTTSSTKGNKEAEPYQVLMKTLDGKTKILRITAETKISELKKDLGYESIDGYLISGGKVLRDELTVADYPNIQELSTIEFRGRLRGGMEAEQSRSESQTRLLTEDTEVRLKSTDNLINQLKEAVEFVHNNSQTEVKDILNNLKADEPTSLKELETVSQATNEIYKTFDFAKANESVDFQLKLGSWTQKTQEHIYQLRDNMLIQKPSELARFSLSEQYKKQFNQEAPEELSTIDETLGTVIFSKDVQNDCGRFANRLFEQRMRSILKDFLSDKPNTVTREEFNQLLDSPQVKATRRLQLVYKENPSSPYPHHWKTSVAEVNNQIYTLEANTDKPFLLAPELYSYKSKETFKEMNDQDIETRKETELSTKMGEGVSSDAQEKLLYSQLQNLRGIKDLLNQPFGKKPSSFVEQTLTQALPPKLQGKVIVKVDPDLPGNTVRVDYKVATLTGQVRKIRMRVGLDATAVDIKLHVKTVELMQRYSGLLGVIRILKQQIQSWIRKNGKPPVGSRAWEAKLEIEKLPRIINERLERLSKADLDADTEASLRADIENLKQQLAQHQQTLDVMDTNPGAGFVAMNSDNTKAPATRKRKSTQMLGESSAVPMRSRTQRRNTRMSAESSGIPTRSRTQDTVEEAPVSSAGLSSSERAEQAVPSRRPPLTEEQSAKVSEILGVSKMDEEILNAQMEINSETKNNIIKAITRQADKDLQGNADNPNYDEPRYQEELDKAKNIVTSKFGSEIEEISQTKLDEAQVRHAKSRYAATSEEERQEQGLAALNWYMSSIKDVGNIIKRVAQTSGSSEATVRAAYEQTIAPDPQAQDLLENVAHVRLNWGPITVGTDVYMEMAEGTFKKDQKGKWLNETLVHEAIHAAEHPEFTQFLDSHIPEYMRSDIREGITEYLAMDALGKRGKKAKVYKDQKAKIDKIVNALDHGHERLLDAYWHGNAEAFFGKSLLETEVNMPREPSTNSDTVGLTKEEMEILSQTASKGSQDLTHEEINAEFKVAMRFKPEEISDGDYIAVIKLSNDHEWKLYRDNKWCRFSETGLCLRQAFGTDIPKKTTEERTVERTNEEKVNILKDALQAGYRLFDTAEIYDSAQFLEQAAEAAEVHVKELQIVYKIKPEVDEAAPPQELGKIQVFKQRLNKQMEVIPEQAEKVLMLHELPSDPEEAELYLKALSEAIDESEIQNVKSIGLSNVDDQTLKNLYKYMEKSDLQIGFVQNRFSPYEQDAEVRDFCKEQNITYMGFGLYGGSSLGVCHEGFAMPQRNLQALQDPRLIKLAEELEFIPSVLLLAWAHQKGVTTVIYSGNHAKENFYALEIQLSENTMAQLDSFFQNTKRESGNEEKLEELYKAVKDSTAWYILDILVENSKTQTLLKKTVEKIDKEKKGNPEKVREAKANFVYKLMRLVTHLQTLSKKVNNGENWKDMMQKQFGTIANVQDKGEVLTRFYEWGQQPYSEVGGANNVEMQLFHILQGAEPEEKTFD
ncbi:MAG: aldo/keto reductase [Nostoc sp.]|uniref:aldo/keto reductase n=1 Tax=Nostoc sp. TaxID=1180 RepID=UPI002FF7A7C0